jgi:membrane protease subunit HflC
MIQNVRYFDKRILTLDNAEPERFITSEKKNVLVDSFVKWRIVDPKLYYISVAGDEARAKTRLSQTVNAGLREEFGKRTVHDVVSGERDKIMEQMREKADLDARKIGVQIVDVRLKRVDLPNEVSDRSIAAWRRSASGWPTSCVRGFCRGRKDPCRCRPQREVIVAEAYRDAQKIKGEGDAKATGTSTPRPSARTPSSTPSTAALRPIAAASRARATSGGRAEFRLLQVHEEQGRGATNWQMTSTCCLPSR